MGGVTHRFGESLADGQRGENVLDQYFAAWYDITRATPGEERLGIDRWFTDRRTDKRFSVQYKTDTAGTPNAFLETGSIGPHWCQIGWIYTCQADRIVYYAPARGSAWWCTRSRLLGCVNEYLAKQRIRAATNPDYYTYGVIVPFLELQRYAERVITIPMAA